MISPRDRLKHILDECRFLAASSAGVSREDFLTNGNLTRAWCRSLEIIGEATKLVPDNFRQQYPRVEWRKMAGMRDQLIHGYVTVDLELDWTVVSDHIPVLRQQVEDILSTMQPADSADAGN